MTTIPATQPAATALEREYLLIRCKILEIASALDRIDRGEGDVSSDPRTEQLRKGLAVLLQTAPPAPRAEQVQLVFSDPYDAEWFSRFTPTR